MKVLMVSELPSKTSGGAEKFCYQLSNFLRNRNIDVIFASPTHTANIAKGKGFKLKKVKNKYLRKMFFDYFHPENVVRIKKVIEISKPDIVHFHNVYGISSSLIKYASEKIPTVVTIHDYWPICFYSTLMKKGSACDLKCYKCFFPFSLLTNNIKKEHLKKAFLIAPSKFMKSMLEKRGFKNVRLIHNGINIPSSSSNFKRRLLYIGRLSHEKGVDFFLNAVKDLDIEIDVFGTGPLYQSLKSLYLNNKKVRIHGFVENIENEYKKGGIFVFPSIWVENLPYSILEAMSWRLPVIASNIGAIPDLIQHRNTGYLFKPGDIFELKNSVLYALNHLDVTKKIIENAYKIVKNNYNWDTTISKYIDLYKEIKSKKHK